MSRVEIILQRALGLLSASILFFMMALTTVDVVGRYVFNKPVNGGFEVTEIMLAALIYCGLPLVSARREHIVIDTLDPFYSAGLKRALDVIAEILCTVVFGGLAVLIYERAERIASYGDTTTVLRLPLAPVAFVMAVMIAITAVIHLWLIFVPHKAHRAADAAADIKNAQ
jgi:TRAP-type C4-dicarboxylate transport system permease small subunit